MLSAIDRNHCPQSIGNPVRNRRNPQVALLCVALLALLDLLWAELHFGVGEDDED